MSGGPWEDYAKAKPAATTPTDGPWADYAKPQATSTTADVAKSAGVGVAEGVIGMPGMVGYLGQQAVKAGVHAGDYLRQKMGFSPLDPRLYEELDQPAPGSTAFTKRAIESVTGPFYKPQTVPGEYARTIGEFAPQAVAGEGGLIARAAQAVVPALTSETAGQVARKVAPDYENAARAVGAVGGGLATLAASAPAGARVATQEALQSAGITQQELQAAQGLMQQATQLPGGGVTLTLDEALNAVTGGRAGRLSQVRRVVENSGGEGARALQEVTAARPAQVQATGQAAVDSIAPNPVPAGQAAAAGQRAAEGAIRDTQAGINAMTRDAYAVSDASRIGPQVHVALMDDPLYARTVQEIRNDPALNRTVGNAADDSGQMVDLVRRRLREQGDAATMPGQASVSNLRSANFYDAAQAPEAALNAASDGAYARAREVQSELRQGMLEPLTNGPVGRIANVDPGSAGASARMGSEMAGVGENTGRYDAVVQQSVRRLVRQDPNAAQTLARDYLGSVFNDAIGTLKSGPDVYGGAGFRAALVGNPAALANVRAMVTQLPQGQQKWAGFSNLLDTLEATGYRPQKGSDTAFNTAIQKELSNHAGPVGLAVETATQGGLNVKQRLSDAWARYRIGSNTRDIAWMLTDPSAAPLLRQLASAPAGSPRAVGTALRLTYMAQQANGSAP